MLGVWVGKLTLSLLRLFRRNATSLPGNIALRWSPNILSRLGKQLERCIVITGTNGKTTTSALISGILSQRGLLIHNKEGANLPQGLVTALLRHTSWWGRLKSKQALLEIDEATLPHVAAFLPIQLAIVTNVFRDQLDRYGELDVTIEKIVEGLSQTKATVLLNVDDPISVAIGKKLNCDIRYYGLTEAHIKEHGRNQVRDGAFCLECGYELQYKGYIYGQLGYYTCPHCSFSRPRPDFTGAYDGQTLAVTETSHDADGANTEQTNQNYKLPVRGIFNVYNALSAIGAARTLGVPAAEIARGMTSFQAPLGRMQVFQTEPSATLNLIKNPTGCNSVLQTLVNEPAQKFICIAINDQAADGKDVSWLWDADFELLVEDENVTACVTTGLRAEDMALRLKYAGLSSDKLVVKSDMEQALTHVFAHAHTRANAAVHVISTYTALYEMAQHLRRRELTDAKTTSYRPSLS